MRPCASSSRSACPLPVSVDLDAADEPQRMDAAATHPSEGWMRAAAAAAHACTRAHGKWWWCGADCQTEAAPSGEGLQRGGFVVRPSIHPSRGRIVIRTDMHIVLGRWVGRQGTARVLLRWYV